MLEPILLSQTKGEKQTINIQSKINKKIPDLVVHITKKAEAGGYQFETSLSYVLVSVNK